MTRISEYREDAAKLIGEPSLALLFRHLSASRLVTIAQIEGRVRGAGSEFVLAMDMRFAARESAIFGQFEPAFGVIPGGGAAQHLVASDGPRPSARGHAGRRGLRRGSGRALRLDQPRAARGELGEFVRALAHRIASFPAAGRAVVKDRVNAIALAPAEDFRRDSDLFLEGVREPEAQSRIGAAIERGFQTRDAELDLPGCSATWLIADRLTPAAPLGRSIARLRILPVGPFGSASTNQTSRGYLYAATRCLTKSRSSVALTWRRP